VLKTSSNDATGVAPSGLGCAAWQFGVCCQVIRENQRSLERMVFGECCLAVWGVLPGDKGKP